MKSSSRMLLLALAATSAVSAGCRRKLPDSEVKSVDAITTGNDAKRHLGDCGDAQVSDRTPEAALEKVFARLPEKFRKQFPNLKASVRLQDPEAVTKDCAVVTAGDSRQEERAKNLSSCWTLDLSAEPEAPKAEAPKEAPKAEAPKVEEAPKANGSALVPTIHVTRNRNLVHRDLLAMTTYAVLELYIDKVGDALEKADDAAKKTLTDELQKVSPGARLEDLTKFVAVVKADRQALAQAVVDDLEASKSTDALAALANFRRMFGASSNAELAGSRGAGNFFFAEMVESYYCSADSRAAIEKAGLKSAWAKMQGIAKYLDSP